MQFKFKIQQYQTDAAKAVTDVFQGQPNGDPLYYLRDVGVAPQGQLFGASQLQAAEGYGNADVVLPDDKLLENVRKVQRANHLPESGALVNKTGRVQLDVEMETGTGKTYVYTKTMLELNRLYGWSKFIVVVPSIAIREGVYKSLKNTEQHFFEQYGKTVRYFIYDSKRLGELDAYSESPDVNVMIINMQAFNTSFKEGGRSKEARIMYSERDEFGSRRPIDVIAANHPIVIQDEPQKMGGKATQEGIRRFKPLFCLNYSATHAEHHNEVYALDAVDAYNQRLVKRIEVKGFELKGQRGTDEYLYLQDVLVTKNHEPQAVIEHNRIGATGVRRVVGRFDTGDSIYEASGKTRLEAYRGYTIAPDGIVPDMDDRPASVTFLNGLTLTKGEVYGDSAGKDMSRVQIRETIRSHLEKEQALFVRGIKCLTLFFIDEVAKYRAYGDDGEKLTVGYGKVFEEEYAAEVERFLAERIVSPEYAAYLRGIDVHDTHKGYFSIDKKGHSVDSKVKRGSDESDDESAYDLILKDKERLLSFAEPTRFIFSHSALREGWDNPNIFQICTLKHSDSETGKRQEVGRGLRLCVNQEGERQDLQTLGEQEVQAVNVLTVIASESYASFTKSLQSDILSELHARPKEVTKKLFAGFTLRNEAGVEYTLTDADAEEIVYALVSNRLVDKKHQPTQKFRDEGLSGIADEDLSEHLDGFTKQIEALVKSVYDPHALDGMFQNGLRTKVTQNKLNANFKKREFQDLWQRINHKHAYTVDFDENELRAAAIKNIDEHLRVSKLTYQLMVGGQKAKASREELEAGSQFAVSRSHTEELGGVGVSSSVTYDLLGEVAQGAAITRRSAAAILQGIHPQKFAMYAQNPEEFIAKVSQLIVEAKASMIVDHITYHQLDETYDSEIFAEHMPEDASRAYDSKKGVQNYVFPDSAGERAFAEGLDAGDEVVVYAKLPRAFKIPTPVGNYAPDWAIAFRKGSVKHVFFVAETKGSLDSLQLRGVEDAKIRCTKELFREMSASDVTYDVVTSYYELMQRVMR